MILNCFWFAHGHKKYIKALSSKRDLAFPAHLFLILVYAMAAIHASSRSHQTTSLITE